MSDATLERWASLGPSLTPALLTSTGLKTFGDSGTEPILLASSANPKSKHGRHSGAPSILDFGARRTEGPLDMFYERRLSVWLKH